MLELMVVVTIIGILAVVLLPRMGWMREGVRESSVESNMLAVRSVCERYVDDYISPSAFFASIKAELDSRSLENPFTDKRDIVTVNAISATTNWGGGNEGAAVQMWQQTGSAITPGSMFAKDGGSHSSEINSRGSVIVAATTEAGLTVYLFAYDGKGNSMTSMDEAPRVFQTR